MAKAVEGPDAEPDESSVDNGTVTDPEQDESLSSPAEATGPAKKTQSRSDAGAVPSMEPEFATLGRQSRNDDNDNDNDEERAPLARPVRQAR